MRKPPLLPSPGRATRCLISRPPRSASIRPAIACRTAVTRLSSPMPFRRANLASALVLNIRREKSLVQKTIVYSIIDQKEKVQDLYSPFQAVLARDRGDGAGARGATFALQGLEQKSRARPASPRSRPTSPVNGAGGITGCRDDSEAPESVPAVQKFFRTRLSDRSP